MDICGRQFSCAPISVLPCMTLQVPKFQLGTWPPSQNNYSSSFEVRYDHMSKLCQWQVQRNDACHFWVMCFQGICAHSFRLFLFLLAEHSCDSESPSSQSRDQRPQIRLKISDHTETLRPEMEHLRPEIEARC